MKAEKLQGPIDIAISGMQAQQENMSSIFRNVKNYRNTNAGQGEPYRRVEARLQTTPGGGVEVGEIVEDKSSFMEFYDPGHPEANAAGYVLMPNINLPREMINLTLASKAYKANAAILKRYQQAMETTLELLR
jgi:flagellar basal-body rod protein FlgC